MEPPGLKPGPSANWLVMVMGAARAKARALFKLGVDEYQHPAGVWSLLNTG
jgi:hypothetical protein